jgi:hypothetical protein
MVFVIRAESQPSQNQKNYSSRVPVKPKSKKKFEPSHSQAGGKQIESSQSQAGKIEIEPNQQKKTIFY